MPSGEFQYYRYAIDGDGVIIGAPIIVTLSEPNGLLTDAFGSNVDDFTLDVDGYLHNFSGGFASGPYAGDFTAELMYGADPKTPSGTYYFYSSSPNLPVGFDVLAQANFVGKVANTTIGSEAQLDGLEITLTCFLAGTRISTPAGEVPIECLQIGDLVSTCGGPPQPVKFIGRQTVACRMSDPLLVLPVRVAKDAIAEGVPSRDLRVSSGHALLIDGLLVIAGALVNGTSIVRERQAGATIIYYHIELERHEIIFAEGTPTETYCDQIPRSAFDNAEEYGLLYPSPRPIPALNIPLVKSARQLPAAVRRRLEQRGSMLLTHENSRDAA